MNNERKWELRHDLLVPKIWAKLPEQDRVLREIKRSLIQRHADYADGKGSLLPATELEAWSNFYPELKFELTEAQQTYFADSEKALEHEKVKQFRLRLIMANLVGLSVISIGLGVLFYYNYYFFGFQERQKIASRVESILLREADREILALNYDKALEWVKTAWDLDINRSDATRRFQEIAFFFTESGAYEKATDSVLAYIERKPAHLSSKPQERRRQLLESIRDIAPNYLKDTLEKRYYPDMVSIAGGLFVMGIDTSKFKEVFRKDFDLVKPKEWFNYELPHQVALDNYKIARTETTVWQYYLYIRHNKKPMPNEPSWGWIGNQPMVKVDWYDILVYANWLSKQLGKDTAYLLSFPDEPDDLHERIDIIWQDSVNWMANGFRLPTEAEWEYAARGGQNGKGYIFSGSDTLVRVARSLVGETGSVAGKGKNELGLYDMSGNVWEWCWDWFEAYDYSEDQEKSHHNPRGPSKSYTVVNRVRRGGAWDTRETMNFRISNRLETYPKIRDQNTGFRLAQSQ